ncbi:MAG TPA: DUF1467 family protein [Thalassobaculum sp.]
MDIVSAVVVYVLLWWFGFFLALPIGVQVPDESEVGRGHARSAPRRPYLLRKMLAATLIAAVLWIVVYLLVSGDFYSFRQDVRSW